MDRTGGVSVTAIVVAVLAAAGGVAESQAAFGELKYVDKFSALPVDDRATVKRGCPGGTHVVSGGQYVFSAFQTAVVTASGPFDDGDGDKRPDDGWKTTVDGSDGFANTLTVHAICSSRQPDYVTRKVRMRADDRRAAHSVCPFRTRVLGGGFRLPGHYGSSYMHDSAPFEIDEWEVFAFTFEPGTMVMWAVCARTKTDSEFDSGVAPGGSFGEAAATCPADASVIGGGVAGGDIGLTGTISAPFDGGDDGSRPDDGWAVEMDNDEGSPLTVFAEALCVE